jgi:hypothetical protein
MFLTTLKIEGYGSVRQSIGDKGTEPMRIGFDATLQCVLGGNRLRF